MTQTYYRSREALTRAAVTPVIPQPDDVAIAYRRTGEFLCPTRHAVLTALSFVVANALGQNREAREHPYFVGGKPEHISRVLPETR